MEAEERRRVKVKWVGSSYEDLLGFPRDVIRALGVSLHAVQLGGPPPASAKVWRGDGPGVFELRENSENATFRLVYWPRGPIAVYVLHCFQKKSQHGGQTARRDVEKITRCMREARKLYETEAKIRRKHG